MMRDASNRPDWRAIVITEQSRFSREDPLDTMAHFKLLRDSGIDLYSCQTGKIGAADLPSFLTTAVGQFSARDYSLKVAFNSVSGKRRLLQGGRRLGPAVFALDKEYTDSSGQLMRRVHFRERFAKPRDWVGRPVHSDDLAAREALQWMAEQCDAGGSCNRIAIELNRRGVLTSWGGKWDGKRVKAVLQNRIYVGTAVSGVNCRGKFNRIDEHGPIVVEGVMPPLIEPRLFERVQERLRERYRSHRKPEKYLLSGLLYCGDCGRALTGACERYALADGSRASYFAYVCRRKAADWDEQPHRRPSFHAPRVDRAIVEAIRNEVLTEERLGTLRSEAEALLSAPPQPGPEEARRTVLKQRIEVQKRKFLATEDPDLTRALAESIEECTRELKVIDECKKPGSRSNMSAGLLLKLKSELRDAYDDLAEAQPEKLRSVIGTFVSRIALRRECRRDTRRGDRAQVRLTTAMVEFHADFGWC